MIRLKELRNEMQISQAELAQIFKTTQRNICNWEQGKFEPDFATLIKLAKFFNVTTDYLLGIEDENIFRLPDASEQKLLRLIANLSEEKKQALTVLLKSDD